MNLLLMPFANAPLVQYGFLSGELSSKLSFARASSAQCYDNEGISRIAAVDVARFDHDPANLKTRGLLIEPEKTNRVRNSNGASWAVVNTSITLNNATSPDGATNAFRVTDDGSTTYHTVSTNEGSEFVSGTAYTSSVYLKAGTQYIVQLRLHSAAFGANLYANFNLIAGTVTACSVGATALMVPIGNGWYRCGISAVATTSTYTVSLVAGGTSNNGSFVPDTTYAGTGLYYFAFGAQGEPGGISTHIPTSGGAATRAADRLSFTIPSGVTSLRYTFDDASTQDVSVSAGFYTVPTTLNRFWIKKISSE